MKSTTEQIVSALRVLSVEIHSEDGVANAVVAEAADRLTLMANLVARHVEETKDDVEQMAVASETMVEATSKIQSLRARIKRLEEELGEANAEINRLTQKVGQLYEGSEEQKHHIKLLEEAGHELLYDNDDMSNINRWHNAKKNKL